MKMDLQKKEEAVQEVPREQETPKGFNLVEVPTSFGIAITLNGEEVNVNELLVKMANALKDAGLLKD